MKIEDWLAAVGTTMETELARLLADPEGRTHAKLADAMRYSVLGGGKRVRPALCLAAAQAVGAVSDVALPGAAALEMIHAYSLVHDDLPAMDDDPVRRGKPSNHVAFGEAIAILAGDGLLTEAFHVLAREGLARGLAAERIVASVAELAQAAGAEGMVGGQTADIEAEGRQASFDEVREIHRRKTGALLRVAVRLGAIAGGAGPGELAALTTYGERIGFAFQVADDLLDEVGNTAATGKAAGRDRDRGKSTIPAALGQGETRELLRQLLADGLGAIAAFDARAEPLRGIARFVVERAI